jgi:transaldolase
LAGPTAGKDSSYPDTRYVTSLVALDVVNTMPEAALRAAADHAQIPADSIHGRCQEAHQVLDELPRLGVDYDDSSQRSEDDDEHGCDVPDCRR